VKRRGEAVEENWEPKGEEEKQETKRKVPAQEKRE